MTLIGAGRLSTILIPVVISGLNGHSLDRKGFYIEHKSAFLFNQWLKVSAKIKSYLTKIGAK